jgi:hypothetical protein
MTSFSHIVNPVYTPRSPDLMRAQPITFETMRRAREFAAPETAVSLFAANYAEDVPIVPPDFIQTPLLDRSVLDFGQFKVARKLPLLGDILGRLYDADTAEYMIYTNVDIALQPHFYSSLQEFTEQGYDAFVINRRTISGQYQTLDQIPLMLLEEGRLHRGWDCFVFRRDCFRHIELGHICIGAPRAGLALLANLEAIARSFRVFEAEYLTFHLGDERGWRDAELADYDDFNTAELTEILARLQEVHGPFPNGSITASFLWRTRTFGPLYDRWARSAYLPAAMSRVLNRLLRRTP